jgi:hypothetical protein
MLYLGESDVLALVHLLSCFGDDGAFFAGKNVVRINRPIRLERFVLVFIKHKITFLGLVRRGAGTQTTRCDGLCYFRASDTMDCASSCILARCSLPRKLSA